MKSGKHLLSQEISGPEITSARTKPVRSRRPRLSLLFEILCTTSATTSTQPLQRHTRRQCEDGPWLW